MHISDVKKVVPHVGGWVELKLSLKAKDVVNTYIADALSGPKDMRSELAGNVSKGTELKDTNNWLFKEVIVPAISGYENAFGSELPITPFPQYYKLSEMWVNHQKKYEFNPPHRHSGIYSFVIWVKIPTDYREEYELPFAKGSSQPCSSDFSFHYTNIHGKIVQGTYRLDSTLEGTMLLFRSSLVHEVLPFFTSDDYRVSISGNVRV